MGKILRTLAPTILIVLLLSSCGAEPGGASAVTVSQPGDDATTRRLTGGKGANTLPEVGWTAGTHYVLLTPRHPSNVSAGEVEVIEFFWYACPHCNAMEPYLARWMHSKPDYIVFRREHVLWKPAHRAHARLYYTLNALGREDLHPEVLEAIHRQGNFLYVQDDSNQTFKLQLAFAVSHGIEGTAFRNAYQSAAVNSRLQLAEETTRRYRVAGVPAMVIAGTYMTDSGRAGGYDNLLALVSALAAREKSL